MWDSRLEETVPRVRETIRDALDRAGRGDDVTLVAVTKGHPAEAAAAAVRAGLVHLGENRVQELEGKVGQVAGNGARWHLIGHLQRNKARAAIPLIDWIHSVDSPRLARALSKEAAKAERTVRGLVQVNASGEASKGGFEAGAGASAVVDAVAEVAGLPGVEIHGLMTMAPYTDDEGVLRRTFATTRRLLEEVSRQAPEALRGRELSMGMSNDYAIAIEEGATMVRLGTVLFGERDQ